MKIYVMDSWKDVGGSDLWLSNGHFETGTYDVWHNSETKYKIWFPNADWSYKGVYEWDSYGVPARVAPVLWTTKRNATPKARAKGKAKIYPKAQGITKSKL